MQLLLKNIVNMEIIATFARENQIKQTIINMKKLLVLAAAALMAATNVNAQNGYDDTKHEVAISLGALSNSQWIDVFEDLTTAIFVGKLDDRDFDGPFSAEYFYHVKNWLGVGGIFVYGHSTQDILEHNTKIGDAKDNYLTLMPAVKFDWLRKKNFGMYSKLGIGATYRSEKIEYNENNGKDYDESAFHVNWQVSLLGIEAGSPTLRGFVELGTGEQGMALIGVRYKF